jgi:hypothetical protein
VADTFPITETEGMGPRLRGDDPLRGRASPLATKIGVAKSG